jgi:hypothetical protein
VKHDVSLEWNFDISAFRGSGSRGGSDFGIESFKLPVREIPKKDNIVGYQSEFSGLEKWNCFVNTTPEITKRETSKGGVSVRGYVDGSSKEGSSFDENPERPSISPWEKAFRNFRVRGIIRKRNDCWVSSLKAQSPEVKSRN